MLRGESVAEVRGVYLTNDRRRAEWYAGVSRPPAQGGGAIVEARVSGNIMSEKDCGICLVPSGTKWPEDVRPPCPASP
jgi:hypothetical protein